MAATNYQITNKLKSYFNSNRIDRNQVPSQRVQREICKEVGVSSMQLVEFLLYGEVTFRERKQAR